MISKRSAAPSSNGWMLAVALGIWLSVAAVWPAQSLRIGQAQVLWQPLLMVSLLLLMVAQRRRYGWGAAAAHSLLLYVFFAIASWLPYLRTTTYWTDYPYPRFYAYYLDAYEGGLAALIAYAGCRAIRQRVPSWWNRGGWSRPLVVAPILLVIRGLGVDHGISLLLGVIIGAMAGWFRPSRNILPAMPMLRRPWMIVCGVFLAAALLAYGAGLRIYHQTGDIGTYTSASDDGIHYYWMAHQMAEQPSRLWTGEMGDRTTFTGYYILMACWFMLAGPHIPSWLLWHGVAAGLLAVCVWWMGRRLCGTAGGLIAAGLVAADHVMLHLMGTLNAETFFIPTLYLGLALWIMAREQSPAQGLRTSVLAGVALGVATIFRPTSVLLPFALVLLVYWERPKRPWRHVGPQAARMLAGFAVPIVLMLIRHRMAWGQWTLAAEKSSTALANNYAFRLHGQHVTEIGFDAWSRLLAHEPSLIWQHMIPAWWKQLLHLWTHPGFGQMDLLQGLVHVGPYQAALTSILIAGMLVGVARAARRRSRCDLALLILPAYFSALVSVFYVLNSRYRAPYIPVLYLLCCLGFTTAVAAARRTPQGPVMTLDSGAEGQYSTPTTEHSTRLSS